MRGAAWWHRSPFRRVTVSPPRARTSSSRDRQSSWPGGTLRGRGRVRVRVSLRVRVRGRGLGLGLARQSLSMPHREGELPNWCTVSLWACHQRVELVHTVPVGLPSEGHAMPSQGQCAMPSEGRNIGVGSLLDHVGCVCSCFNFDTKMDG